MDRSLSGSAQPLPGPVLAVVGPTGVGKSELAVELALRVGGEVVNADSMQLYRGMDIGTAKLAPDQRRGVPHHLLDVWPVTRTASVADYQQIARAAVDDVLARGLVPVLVGGSGLYVRAVLDPLRFPGTDPELRRRLEDEVVAVGAAALHRRLEDLDPATADRISPANPRRIVRALEVIELTGQRYASTLPAYRSVYAVEHIGLDREPADLDRRLEARVERMWAAGLPAEVSELADRGLREGVTAGRALGYAQALAELSGSCSGEQARADTVRATKRFVRRQRSWFRRDPRIDWHDAARVEAAGLAPTIGR